MASSLALRRALLGKLMNPTRSSQAGLPMVSRAYNTSAQMTTRGGSDEDDYDRSVEDVRGRRRERAVGVPGFFSDVFDPFGTTKSLSQLMNMMDRLTDNPFLSATRGMTGGARRGWDVKEDENALHLRVDMPGLSKENVKISVEQNTLVIRGEEEERGREGEADSEVKRRYSSRVDLPTELYKVDEIKAEMKNGVLKVVVPKVKEEERKDVIQVNVE